MDYTDEELRIIGECLRAAAEGPFFDDWEFDTLFGLSRAEVQAIADAWPGVDMSHEKVRIAIRNAMGQLLGYPHGEEESLRRYVSVPRERISEVLNRVIQGDSA
jgi:hypothetical protein